MLNISWEVHFYIILGYVLIFVFYIKYFELVLEMFNFNDNKKTARMMHPSLTIRVISLVNITC